MCRYLRSAKERPAGGGFWSAADLFILSLEGPPLLRCDDQQSSREYAEIRS